MTENASSASFLEDTVPNDLARIVQQHVTLADPHLCNDDSNALALQAALFDTLVVRDERGAFSPHLAESWEVSEDALVWRFTLRSNVRCHDGKALTGEDVLASLERVRDPSLGGVLGTEGVYASYLEGARIKLEHLHLITIELARPLADLLDLIVDFPIVPARAFDTLTTHPIGTGPYRLLERQDANVTLGKFASYWGNPARFERLEFLAEANPTERAEMILKGHADLAANIPSGQRKALVASPHATLLRAPSSMCAVFFFNLHQPGPYQDTRVRQALHYALNVPAMIDQALHGEATPLNGPFTPLHLAHDSSLPPYPHDPARASSLLDEAGISDLSFTIDVPTRLPDEATTVASIMKQQLGDIGVHTDIISYQDRPAYAHMVRDKRIHDACCFDSGPISSYRVLVEKFHSQVKGPWWQGYANSVVDALIDKVATLTDDAERQQLYHQIYRTLHEDAPWLYLYSPSKAWLASPTLATWRPSVTGVTVL